MINTITTLLIQKMNNKHLRFYLPGMFTFLGQQGLYPAISITGAHCQLDCAHCRSKILKDMIPATTPRALIECCLELERKGMIGCLISGGSDLKGQLPWKAFTGAIRKIKDKTRLKISIHTGIIEQDTAHALKDAGVDQVLIDVIGADKTLKQVYNLDIGTDCIYRSLENLYNAGHHVIPHILIGIHFGEILGEHNALAMLQDFSPASLVLVILNPLYGTPMEQVEPVSVHAFVDIVQEARKTLPNAIISLGCARPRDKTCFLYEKAAIDCGVSKIAFPTEKAIEYAKKLDMEVVYEKTCCSW